MHMRRQEEVNNNNPDTEWSLYVDGQPEGYGVPPNACYNGFFRTDGGVRSMVAVIIVLFLIFFALLCQGQELEHDVNLEFAPSRSKSGDMTVTGKELCSITIW